MPFDIQTAVRNSECSFMFRILSFDFRTRFGFQKTVWNWEVGWALYATIQTSHHGEKIGYNVGCSHPPYATLCHIDVTYQMWPEINENERIARQSYRNLAQSLMGIDWQLDGLIGHTQNSYRAFLLSSTVVGTTPKRLMTAVKSRCFLPLMAIHWTTSPYI